MAIGGGAGQQMPAQQHRVDDRVGAGLVQQIGIFRSAHAHADAGIGRQAAGGQHDQRGGIVAAGGDDHAGGAGNAGGVQHVIVIGIANDAQHADGVGDFDAAGIVIDHHDGIARHPLRDQLVHRGSTAGAIAADDDMAM